MDSPGSELMTSPASLLKMALENHAAMDVIERLSALKERADAEAAKREFGEAIGRFQARGQIIQKSRKADRYAYAGFDDIWGQVRGPLGEEKISVSFSSPVQTNDRYMMNVNLRVGSYAEDRPFVAPWPDLQAIAKRQGISEPQAMGVVSSYYKRYALCNALNIVVGDEPDLDGVVPKLTEEQIEQLNRKIEEVEAAGLKHDHKSFLKFWDCDNDLGDMARANFGPAMKFLEQRIRNKK